MGRAGSASSLSNAKHSLQNQVNKCVLVELLREKYCMFYKPTTHRRHPELEKVEDNQ
jgi:HKD family nuclease